MSFLGKANFCSNGHSQLWRKCRVIQSDTLTISHSPTHFFSLVYFSFSALHQLEWFSHLQQSPVPMQFLHPDVVIATDAMPPHWAFYFQGSGLPLSVSVSWSGSRCMAHIALQELQATTMMLCRMTFSLSGKVVALHLKWHSISFSFQAGLQDIESDQQAQYYSYSSIHSYPSQCGGQLSVLESVASRMASSPTDGSSSFLPFWA